MDWYKQYEPQEGYKHVIGPSPDGLQYLDFGVLFLKKGESYTAYSGQSEVGLITVFGTYDVKVENEKFKDVGERDNFFTGRGAALYIPPGKEYKIIASTDLEIAVGGVEVESGGPVTLIRSDEMVNKVFGEGISRRDIRFAIHDSIQATRLYAGETFSSPGSWGGFPPHKHDRDNLPEESANEEVFYYKFEPTQGFSLMNIYDHEGLDEVFKIRHNDVMAVPRGYHCSSSVPGYKYGLIWFMAGNKRPWKPFYDPDHAWLL